MGRDLAEVVADAKYGTTANYRFLEQEGIAASIPLHATKATYRALTIDAFVRTFRAKQSIQRRKVWVETVFGDGKEQRGLRRAQFRGRDRMPIQALLTAAHNVRKLALRKRTKPESGVAAQENGGPIPHFSLFFRS